MQKFDRSHLGQILSAFGEFLTANGFRKKKRDRYIRSAEDEIVHGADLLIWRRYGELRLEPVLAVFHDEVRRLVHDGLGPATFPPSASERSMASVLDYRPVAFLVGELQGTGAIAHYSVSEPRAIPPVMNRIFDDFDLVAEDYFSSRTTLDSLTRRFETDPQSGGSARLCTLMALYFHRRDLAALRALMDSLNEDNAAPMTLCMKDYLLKRLSDSA